MTSASPITTRPVLAFDLYGTLVDPIGIWQQIDVPADRLRLAELWRQKQLEYTFRLTTMGRYEDFATVTRKALLFALQANNVTLEEAQITALLNQYNNVAAFPDVASGLEQLQQAGHSLVVLSNGTPRMIEAALDAAKLRARFSLLVSIDEVQLYKPAPRVYRHLANRVSRPPAEVRLISANPFDVQGAMNAGLQATWLDRSGGLFDTLMPPPQSVIHSLVDLLNPH